MSSTRLLKKDGDLNNGFDDVEESPAMMTSENDRSPLIPKDQQRVSDFSGYSVEMGENSLAMTNANSGYGSRTSGAGQNLLLGSGGAGSTTMYGATDDSSTLSRQYQLQQQGSSGSNFVIGSNASLVQSSSSGNLNSISSGRLTGLIKSGNAARSAYIAGRMFSENNLHDSNDEYVLVQPSPQIDMTQLQLCEEKVQLPFEYTLNFLGWKPFPIINERLRKNATLIYVLFFLCMIFYNYTYDIYTCYNGPDDVETCPFLLSSYVIPDMVHLSSYLLAMYHFRKQNGVETMNKLFSRLVAERIDITLLISTLRMYLSLGAVWLLIRIAFNVLRFTQVQQNKFELGMSTVTTIIQIAATFAADTVYAAIVVCYAIQCRLCIYYFEHTSTSLLQGRSTLRQVMKGLGSMQWSINKLNNGLGNVISVSIFMFALLTLSAFVTLLDKDTIADYTNVEKATKLIQLLLWLSMLVSTLTQAARLTEAGNHLKWIGAWLRTEGVNNTTTQELDSFMLFMSHLRIEAKIFKVPINAAGIGKVVFVTCIAVIIMFQLGLIELWIGAN